MSPDSAAFAERFGWATEAPFPLVANPRRRIARAFGAHGPVGGSARRAMFVLDGAGVLRKRIFGEALIRRHVYRALDAVQSLAPAPPNLTRGGAPACGDGDLRQALPQRLRPAARPPPHKPAEAAGA